MTVSSGTYVRSLVHDIALAVDSAAHVVELVRTRQGPFALDPSASSTVEGEDSAEPLHSVVSWQVLEEGIKTLRNSSSEGQEKEADGDEDMSPWEAAVVKALI
jgi:tRNA pseudouridine55 synthase